MENHMENNFREIQKILDSCIAHDYKTKVDALFLKREYLTQVQLKDYLRQEIFRVTENIVAIQQKYRVVRNIVLDMDIPDFFVGKRLLERLCFSIRCLSCSGYLMRHSIRRISVFKSPIASSIRCK